MKKFVFTMAFAAITLASCSNNEDAPQMPEEALVPIQPSAVTDVLETSEGTRAEIAPNAVASLLIWESTTASAATTVTGSDAKYQSTVTLANVTGNNNANLNLNPVRYYNAEATINSYIAGVYPKIEAGVMTYAAGAKNVVTVAKQDGTLDVCAAVMKNANKSNPFSATNGLLEFTHKTAKIVFKAKKDATAVGDPKLTEIVINNAKVPSTLTFTTTGVTVADVAATALAKAYSNTTGMTLTTTAAAVSGTDLFIRPAATTGAGCITLTVKTKSGTVETTYANVPLTISGNQIEEGKQYEITLTFKQKEITPTVKVVHWSSTVTGTSDVM